MFWNIYWKRILCCLRDKDTMIWTWVFPIMLSTLFYFTFSSLDTSNSLREIPLGVIDNAAYRQDTALVSALESVSGKDSGGLFKLTTFTDTSGADAMLERGGIDGYIITDGGIPTLIVSNDGLNQTIAKSFLDNYLQTLSGIETILSRDPSAATRLPSLLQRSDYTEELSLSANPATERVGYFYALLAMVSLYGGFQGLTTITYMQANLSPLGARRTMSPSGRLRTIVYDLLGGITVHFMCLIVVVLYIIFALKVSFGPQLAPVLLTCLAGSIMGVSLGSMVSVTSRLKETAKVAVLISFTMVCCFLSGLMTSGINYAVMQAAPAVAWLNPAARLADAFYCLYYYDTYDRYLLNLGILVIMSIVMLAVTAVFAGRQRYESI